MNRKMLFHIFASSDHVQARHIARHLYFLFATSKVYVYGVYGVVYTLLIKLI